jgi:hypothetical protein
VRIPALVLALAACGGSPTEAPAPTAPSIPVPQVAGNGFVPFVDGDLAVIVTTTGIVADGQPIASITDGKIDPAALEGGALGVNIRRLGVFVGAKLEGKPDPRVALLLDPATPYRVLISTIFSIKQIKVRRFELVAHAGGKQVAAPITLPNKAPSSGFGTLYGLTTGERRPGSDLGAQIDAVKERGQRVGTGSARKTRDRELPPKPTETAVQITEADAAAIADKLTMEPADNTAPGAPVMQPVPDERDLPIGLYVSVMKTEIVVWSISRLEGTLKDPRARIQRGPKAAAELSAVLADIVQKRWATKPRAAATKSIVLQADGDVTAQVVAELIGAMRAGADGRELFPDVMLSSGFE